MAGSMDLTGTISTPLSEEEAAWLRRLLGELGRQATEQRFRVAPNPCVGAAVLSDGVEIARGFHEVWGGPHAEIGALEAAAGSGVSREHWDTLVVTLEPCSTVGKTPSCTEAVLRSGVRRVVVAELDPDPRHRGRGLELLHDQGIEVVHLPGAAPLDVIAPHFVRWTRPERIRRGRPWTIAKWAQTRTGQLTPPADVGQGRWISSSDSLERVHVMRSRVDAIVTGVGTVMSDDPRLTVRPPGDTARAPLRVVLDTELRTSPEARILQPAGDDEGGGPVHVFGRPGAPGARRRALEAAGAQVHAVRCGDDGRPSLREVCSWLWAQGVQRALLEAGPRLVEAWFQAELVDQVAVYTGDVNGGRGPSLAALLRPERLDGVRHEEVGRDALLEAFLVR